MIKRSFRDEHILFERETWSRGLDFISAECIHCKNHLAALVNSGEEDVIDLSERYLNNLLQIEALVKLLRKEIAGFDQSFVAGRYVNGELTANRKRITAQLLRVQKDFYLVRAELLVQLSDRG